MTPALTTTRKTTQAWRRAANETRSLAASVDVALEAATCTLAIEVGEVHVVVGHAVVVGVAVTQSASTLEDLGSMNCNGACRMRRCSKSLHVLCSMALLLRT
jgi:hypothetical protein